jgi:hypothetical protein
LDYALPTTIARSQIAINTIESEGLASISFNFSASSKKKKGKPMTSDLAIRSGKESDATRLYNYHLSLLTPGSTEREIQEATVAPIFTMPVLEQAEAAASNNSLPTFPQYGLLAGITNGPQDGMAHDEPARLPDQDPRIFFNIAAPSSTFICGSQGSGKSHTLSCLLENCLIPSDANKLPRPLTGLVFHYDMFFTDVGGSPCEAAFLASDPQIKVRVLCSPTNLRTIRVS